MENRMIDIGGILFNRDMGLEERILMQYFLLVEASNVGHISISNMSLELGISEKNICATINQLIIGGHIELYEMPECDADTYALKINNLETVEVLVENSGDVDGLIYNQKDMSDTEISTFPFLTFSFFLSFLRTKDSTNIPGISCNEILFRIPLLERDYQVSKNISNSIVYLVTMSSSLFESNNKYKINNNNKELNNISHDIVYKLKQRKKIESLNVKKLQAAKKNQIPTDLIPKDLDLSQHVDDVALFEENEFNVNKLAYKLLLDEAKEYLKWYKTLLPKDIADSFKNNLDKWATAYIDLRTKFNQNKKDIYTISEWARKHDFWKNNFYSPAKLTLVSKSTGIRFYFLFAAQMKKHDGKSIDDEFSRLIV